MVTLHLVYNELRNRRASIPYLNAGQSFGTVQDCDSTLLKYLRVCAFYTLEKWIFGLHQSSMDDVRRNIALGRCA
jgi:hypothetical protein